VFSKAPLNLASGRLGPGHGSSSHAPVEYLVIESTNPSIDAWNGEIMWYVRYLYGLGK